MSFYHRYELVKLVNNGDPKSFEAREIQTGRPVLLHLWSMSEDSATSPLLLRMRGLVQSESIATSGRLLEVQETAQPPYAVTAVEPGFASLESWLDSLGAAAPPGYVPPPQPPAVPAPPVPEPGPAPFDATVDMSASAPHLFQPPPQAAPPPPAPPPPDTSEFGRMFQGSIAPPPATRPGAPPEPGEFTRLFASSPSAPAAPPQSAPPAASPFSQPPPSSSEPGEFTRLFASPAPASTPPQPAAPAPAPDFAQPQPPPFTPQPMPSAPPPGSGFTELFGGPVQAPSSPALGAAPPSQAFGTPPQSYGAPQYPQAPPRESEFEKFFASPLGASPMPIEEIERGQMAPPAPAPSAKPFRGPGDFTLQFGRDAIQQQQPSGPELSYAPPPTPQARMSSGATGLFSAPEPNYGGAGPVERSGPGEFTRIIQGPPKSGDSAASSSPYSAPPPSAVAAPAPQSKSKMLPIAIAVLSIVVIALVITVVVVVLKK